MLLLLLFDLVTVFKPHITHRSRDLNKNECKCIKQKNYCMYHKTSDNALKSQFVILMYKNMRHFVGFGSICAVKNNPWRSVTFSKVAG